LGRIRVLFASGNAHKLRELSELLPEWEIEPLGAELPEETGSTFYENALAKARHAREVADEKRYVLGEDSGIEVEGLNGRPGVRSARYAGAAASDEENVAKLLAELSGADGGERLARYVSELVLITSDGIEIRGTGTLAGRIGDAPRGSAGFGYDPVFIPVGEERTVAELGDEWKRRHSHRAGSAAAVRAALGAGAAEL
jgi:XTP/dITP diphosphohydrolase